MLFRYDPDAVPESTGSATAFCDLVLRVPKLSCTDLIFSPVIYRSLLASYVFQANDIDFFLPKAISISKLHYTALDLLLKQYPAAHGADISFMYLIPDSLLKGGICLELKVGH